MAKASIKVDIAENRMGDITLTPVSKRVCRQIEKHLSMFGESDCTVYLQGEDAVEHFKQEYLKPEERQHIESGYGITVMMSTWNYGMLRGWDTNELAINPGDKPTKGIRKLDLAMEKDPILSSALYGGLGAIAGSIPGALLGSPMAMFMGWTAGGAAGARAGATPDRKSRATWGGAIGGALAGPVGAALGGGIGARKPDKRTRQLKNKLMR